MAAFPMRRQFLDLRNCELQDDMHRFNADGSFTVDVEKDGKTTEEHREGIEYIKKVLINGQKIRPILVRDNEDGTYQRLDGFKKAMAMKELNYQYVEAYICSMKEYEDARIYPLGTGEIRCWHGGLEKEQHGLFEGGEQPEFDYEKQGFLYKSDDPAGLRIEVSDAIHVHWSTCGQYRLALGERDFLALAEALAKVPL